MAVGTYTLPICDGCKLPWLPVGWTQDSDPRNLPVGAKPLRCGKCKSGGWDKEFTAAARKIDVMPPMDLDVDPEATEITSGVTPYREVPREALEMPQPTARRCKHRMTSCPICNPKEAA